MKKIGKRGSLLLALVMLVGVFAGCGSSDVTENTIEVKKNGSITETLVETLDQDYYDEDELEAFIDDAISAYDGSAGSVKKKKFSVKDGVATLVLKYESSDAYAAFNETEMYAGTIVKALAEGYEFDEALYDVSGSTESDSTEDSLGGSQVSKSEVTGYPSYGVVVLKENTNVKVSGTIVYTTSNVEVLSKNEASVTGYTENGGFDSYTYIIYK